MASCLWLEMRAARTRNAGYLSRVTSCWLTYTVVIFHVTKGSFLNLCFQQTVIFQWIWQAPCGSERFLNLGGFTDTGMLCSEVNCRVVLLETLIHALEQLQMRTWQLTGDYSFQLVVCPVSDPCILSSVREYWKLQLWVCVFSWTAATKAFSSLCQDIF